MASIAIKCFRCVDEENSMVKNGKTSYGTQRFICKVCKKSRVENYKYNAYHAELNQQIIIFTKEGLGIRSTARVLKISTTTLLKRIISIAQNIKPPMISLGKEYEVDELCTYIGTKEKRIWIVCALEKINKQIVSFNIGRRTNQTLKSVIDTLYFSKAKKIFTDKLKSYKSLIQKEIHKITRFATNSIERKFLTLRTHLKRVNRRTICFSKSTIILNAILKIYFWS